MTSPAPGETNLPPEPDLTAGADGKEAPGKLERIIAGQVRHYRTANGLSAAELAARTGMSKAMISKI
jgi:ribosome-binding protein aMBF1 (putative translation factor)